jgi:hypothetical protein
MKTKSFLQLLAFTLAAVFCLQQPAYSQQLRSENVYQFDSEKEAREIIYRITDAVGLKPNFEIKAGNTDNAAALVYKGKRYIIYNPVFIRQISNAVQTDWGGVSILAHEIGHHLNGHTLTGLGSKPALELEADEFSGYVLRKMGANLAQAQAAMRVLASKHDSATHPGRNKRLASIEQGWRHAETQIASIYKPQQNGPVTRETARPSPGRSKAQTKSEHAFQFPARYISKNVHFDKMPGLKFYITTQSNFIYVDEKGYSVLGKLVKQGKSLLLTTGDNDYLIISPKGAILNKARQRVGHLSS